MARIDSELFKKYVLSAEYSAERWAEYFRLLNLVGSGKLEYREQVDSFDKELEMRIEKECIASYVGDLKKSADQKQEYLDDIKKAAAEDNLDLLRILIGVPTQLGGLIGPVSDLFMLNYLADFFSRETDEGKVNFGKYLFEQILDTSEPEEEGYAEVISKIFSLDKGERWFDDFNDQLNKLLYRAPFNERTLEAVKKGLLVTGGNAKDTVEHYINISYPMHMERGE